MSIVVFFVRPSCARLRRSSEEPPNINSVLRYSIIKPDLRERGFELIMRRCPSRGRAALRRYLSAAAMLCRKRDGYTDARFDHLHQRRTPQRQQLGARLRLATKDLDLRWQVTRHFFSPAVRAPRSVLYPDASEGASQETESL